MPCLAMYASAAEYWNYWTRKRRSLDATLTTEIETFLENAAGVINGVLMSRGVCGETFSTYGSTMLKQLNIVLAAAMDHSPCGDDARLTDRDRDSLMRFVDQWLERIARGEIELVDGHTGSLVPTRATAQMALTPWRAAEIIRDQMLAEAAG